MSNKDLKYKNKYFKYKNKYLDLKSQIGGSPQSNIDDVPSTTVDEPKFLDLTEDLQQQILTLVGDVPIFNKTLSNFVREQTLKSVKRKLRLPESEKIENMFMSGPIKVYHPEYLSVAETFILAKMFMINIRNANPIIYYKKILPISLENPGDDLVSSDNIHLEFIVVDLKIRFGIMVLEPESVLEIQRTFLNITHICDAQVNFELLFTFFCILYKKDKLTQLKIELRIIIIKINLSDFTLSFFRIIKGLKQNIISILDIYNSNISPDQVKKLADALKTNKTLKSLYINDNKIGDEGAKAIALALENNKTLISLELIGNNIGDEGGKALLYALTTNTTLRSLELDNNDCSDEIKRDIKNKLAINAINATTPLEPLSIA